MQRKAIELAKKTLVVSMPSNWVKRNNVQKGDALEITENEESLIINIKQKETAKRVVLETKKLGYYDPLYIAYLYQAGVDEVRINFSSPQELSRITQKLPDLMGFEIINQGEGFVEIKNISAPMEDEFEIILRRTFHIIQDYASSSLDAAKNNDFKRIENLLPIENSIDKLTDFCKRVLNKKGYSNPSKTQFAYTIIRDLEKIGDFYTEINEYLLEQKKPLSEETIKVYTQANNYFTLFHDLFYKFSSEKATEFLKLKQILLKDAHNLREDLFVAFNLSALIRMIANLYGPYFLTREDIFDEEIIQKEI